MVVTCSDLGGSLGTDPSMSPDDLELDAILLRHASSPGYGEGGGIYAALSEVTVLRSELSNNGAVVKGGGILSVAGAVDIRDSRILTNFATYECGGACISADTSFTWFCLDGGGCDYMTVTGSECAAVAYIDGSGNRCAECTNFSCHGFAYYEMVWFFRSAP